MLKSVIIAISIVINILLIGFFIYFFQFREKIRENVNKNYNPVNLSYNSPFKKEDINKLKRLIDNGSVLVVDKNNNVLLNYNGDKPYIPASTLKVVTSLAAIHYLGKDYRFKTEFKIDSNKNLYIKGYGDPSLTSDELRLLIYQLFKKGIRKINNIYLDGSYFNDFVQVPGNEDSFEAYDAKNSALAANFNTITFKRVGNNITSGESETPFVSYAIKILRKAEIEENKKYNGKIYNCNDLLLYELVDNRLKPKNNFRIAIKDEEDSLLYFGYLFKELCKDFNINVLASVEIKKSPVELPIFLTFYSSKTLSDIIKHLLKYSNNFTANQILLTLGAVKLNSNPASLKKGVSVVNQFLNKELKIKNFFLSEGSGLSYANRITARQMVEILNKFNKYKYLLSKILLNKYKRSSIINHASEHIFAKSGGLKTVKSLVGFIDTPKFGEVKFAVFLNQSTNNKLHVLKLILSSLY